MFSWDDKYSGAQVPVAKLILKGKAPNDGNWGNYKNQGEQFICNVILQGSNNVKKTNAGVLW